jgi:hypothetical protein
MGGVLAGALLTCVVFGTAALSLPRFSAEHAVACKQCHVNPNGGGARNEFGNHAVAFEELCIPPTKKLLESHYKKPRISESLAFGFDSRWLIFDDPRVFRMQSDLYLTFTPFKNFDYHFRVGPIGSGSMQVSEQYALFRFRDTKYWIKAGTFYPAFGLRQDDHTSYTRSKTGHLSNSYWDGFSVGADIHDVNITAEVFNQSGRGIYNLHAFRTGYVDPIGYLIGGSIQQSERLDGSTGIYPRAKAMFGGVNWDRVTLTGEYDIIGSHGDSVAFYAAATARVVWGLYLTGEYNFFDLDRHLKTGAQKFTRLSVDFYPVPFVKIRPSYTHYKPAYAGESDDFFVQLHVGY